MNFIKESVGTAELPQVVRTVQKGTLAGTIEFYVERRRTSGASPVFS